MATSALPGLAALQTFLQNFSTFITNLTAAVNAAVTALQQSAAAEDASVQNAVGILQAGLAQAQTDITNLTGATPAPPAAPAAAPAATPATTPATPAAS